MGKEELPASVQTEEAGSTQKGRGKRTSWDQLAHHPLVQRIQGSLKATPKHQLCQHKHGCIYYILKVYCRKLMEKCVKRWIAFVGHNLAVKTRHMYWQAASFSRNFEVFSVHCLNQWIDHDKISHEKS